MVPDFEISTIELKASSSPSTAARDATGTTTALITRQASTGTNIGRSTGTEPGRTKPVGSGPTQRAKILTEAANFVRAAPLSRHQQDMTGPSRILPSLVGDALSKQNDSITCFFCNWRTFQSYLYPIIYQPDVPTNCRPCLCGEMGNATARAGGC